MLMNVDRQNRGSLKQSQTEPRSAKIGNFSLSSMVPQRIFSPNSKTIKQLLDKEKDPKKRKRRRVDIKIKIRLILSIN
ncbi:hypothetical protein BpHYR1_016258 [Brachionus plicatilis]|uniref:Uncharacterized protein n=1 Tax=Brachionus plicatilis TaxID=10195 RepID=A0A3M7QIF2_BRAPC|nr:hypothetical protein BpHYR1_016258 [Brachionus plicatilis]